MFYYGRYNKMMVVSCVFMHEIHGSFHFLHLTKMLPLCNLEKGDALRCGLHIHEHEVLVCGHHEVVWMVVLLVS